MRDWSCDFFGSPKEVQVNRHASRLVEGEGKPKPPPPCIPPWPNQPFRLLYQDPPCIPSHCCPTLPSWHTLLSPNPTPYNPAQPHRNTPTTRPIQSSSCSEQQGPTFLSITLASPLTLFLLLSFFLIQCIASNKPLPTPVLLSHLHAGTQRTFQPRPRSWMLVF